MSLYKTNNWLEIFKFINAIYCTYGIFQIPCHITYQENHGED